MSVKQVEWILVVYYGPSAHRAIYGRLGGKDTRYTKDYIQLSRREDFVASLKEHFPGLSKGGNVASFDFRWPKGSAAGQLILHSSDRPHLAWETKSGAPAAWKMTPSPTDDGPQTIVGNPDHAEPNAADEEYDLLKSRGGGDPYLVAMKLRGEPDILHIRTYLENARDDYSWADVSLLPPEIRALAAGTSRKSALAWDNLRREGEILTDEINETLSLLISSDDPLKLIDALNNSQIQKLSSYIINPSKALYFDTNRNHDGWIVPQLLSEDFVASTIGLLNARLPHVLNGDAAAEMLDVSEEEILEFRQQLKDNNFEVLDKHSTVKTRGSAQRVFADAVKSNYEFRCAVTGISTRDFLVAAHIVPWSEDQTIRLDPKNGICLSLNVDRAFEKGYLIVEDDLTIVIDSAKVGDDTVLLKQLAVHHGGKIASPSKEGPLVDYLARRRAFVSSK